MPKGLEIAYENIRKQQAQFNNIYSNLYSHVYIYEDITNATVSRVKDEIEKLCMVQHLETSDSDSIPYFRLPKPIVIHIHSPGGDTNSGIALSNIIVTSEVPIVVIAEGVVASAATFILVKARLSYIVEYSIVLIHQYFGTQAGKAEELKFDLSVGNQFMKFLIDMYSRYTKLTIEKINEILLHDIFMSADETIENGIVDFKITRTPPDKNIFYDEKYSFLHYFSLDPASWQSTGRNILKLVKSNDESEDDIFQKSLYVVKHIHLLTRIKNCTPLFISMCDMTDNNYFNDIIDIIPVLNLISISKIPIYTVMLGPISNFSVLIYIMADYRFMYIDSYIILDFVTFSSPSYKYEDTIINTTFVRNLVKTFFLKRTKLPKNIIKNIFKQRYIITAEDALKYKITNQIIPIRYSEPKHPI